MPTAILELIIVAGKFLSDERKRYYDNKSKELLKRITDVEDSEFYKKDMEAKGKAERQILIEAEDLRKEFMVEVSK
jgi:hypothetical protein